MYLKIVDYCNMSCEHCGMNAKKSGINMSISTFRNAMKFLGDDNITIGGGEPTLHPKFWQILMEAIGQSEYVWMATNGSIKKTSLTLAKLAKKGILGVALSQDSFHDPIDPEVIQAFNRHEEAQRRYKSGITTPREELDLREIRNTESHLIKAGRCEDGDEDECICSDIIILPDGEIKGCGCDDAPSFGNVNGKITIPDDWEHNSCHRTQLHKIPA